MVIVWKFWSEENKTKDNTNRLLVSNRFYDRHFLSFLKNPSLQFAQAFTSTLNLMKTIVLTNKLREQDGLNLAITPIVSKVYKTIKQ